MTESRIPNFVIIGAQKAASTTLLAALRFHPQAWLPPDEDPFFRNPIFKEDRLPLFLSQFANRTELAIGFKCPDYLGLPEVPQRLATELKNPKLIAILRNPVQRAISAYYWHVRWGSLPLVDADIGLNALLDGKYNAIDSRAQEILDWGLYHKHLSTYLRFFDQDQLFVFPDTDLRDAPQSALSAVCRFLEIDSDLNPPQKSMDRNGGVYDHRRLAFLRMRNRLIVQHYGDTGYYNILKPTKRSHRALSASVAATDRYVLAKLFGNQRQEISSATLARLNDFYSEDSKRTQQLLGRTMVSWPPQ